MYKYYRTITVKKNHTPSLFIAVMLLVISIIPNLMAAKPSVSSTTYHNPILFADYSDPDVITGKPLFGEYTFFLTTMPRKYILSTHEY